MKFELAHRCRWQLLRHVASGIVLVETPAAKYEVYSAVILAAGQLLRTGSHGTWRTNARTMKTRSQSSRPALVLLPTPRLATRLTRPDKFLDKLPPAAQGA